MNSILSKHPGEIFFFSIDDTVRSTVTYRKGNSENMTFWMEFVYEICILTDGNMGIFIIEFHV